MSPDGWIDYIISNKPKAFRDTGIIQNLNFNTKHRMVRSCLNESFKNPKPKALNKYNHQIVSTERDIENTIENLLKMVNSDMDLNEKYRKIETKLKEKTRINEKKEIEDRRNLLSKKEKKENHEGISNSSKKIRENMRKDRKSEEIKYQRITLTDREVQKKH